MAEMKGAIVKLMEQELEPETVSMLNEIRSADPGEQRAVAKWLPAKLIAGVCLSRLGLTRAPFGSHLEFAPTLGALFCRYEGRDLAEQIGAEFNHGRARGLDPKVMHRMVKTYYDELRMRASHRVRQEANA